jgi:alpha-L-fucosidase
MSATTDRPALLARPTPAQLAWQDLELGVIIHYDLGIAQLAAPEPLRNTAAAYNPAQLDTDSWVEAARLMGAKYAVFTAKHGSGFLQWQSDAYDFGCRQSPWRGGTGDVVAEFVASCRRAGIRPGLYCHVMWSPQFEVLNGLVHWGRGGDEEKQCRYAATCEKLLTELWSNYGDLVEVWFDGGALPPERGGADVVRLHRELQPNAMVFQGPASTIRWIGNEDGVAGYPCWATVPSIRETEAGGPFRQHGDPNGTIWLPGECDVPLPGHNWDWRPDQPTDIDPLPALMAIHEKSVGRNCNLLLNVAPNAEGFVPEASLRHYAAFGRELGRRYGQPLAETSGSGTEIELRLPSPARIDRAILMEEIAHGERIRRYVLEGENGPSRWGPLCEGESVGHKRIHSFEPVEVAAVRLRVTASAAPPLVRRLAVFGTLA